MATEVKLTNMTVVFDYLENTVIGIENIDGEKTLHYYGYGYFADDGSDKPCRFLEYTFFYVPLKRAIDYGISSYEEDYQDSVKQYITNCTEQEVDEIYEHYDNGNMPKFITECEIDIDTPEGVYILFPANKED